MPSVIHHRQNPLESKILNSTNKFKESCDLITPYTIVLQKAIFSQLVKKFHNFDGVRRVYTVFKTARQRDLPEAR
jgi:hypothetical protein